MNFIEKRTLKVKVITPVHITDGHEGAILPTDYVISQDNILYRIDLTRFIFMMPESQRKDLYSLIETENIRAVRSLVKDCWAENPGLYKAAILYSLDPGDLAVDYRNMDEEKESRLQITPFQRSSGNLLIPGSSVKGPLRTALLHRRNLPDGIDIPLNVPKHDISKQKRNNDTETKKLESEAFGYKVYDPYKKRDKTVVALDPFKCLKISDALIQSSGRIRKVHPVTLDELKKEKDGKKEKDIDIFNEFIDIDTTFHCKAGLDTRYFKTGSCNIGKTFTFYNIIYASKIFYNDLIRHELSEFVDDYSKIKGDSTVCDLYSNLLEMNESANSFVMRLGRFGGMNSKSLNMINKKGKHPKSRNFINVGGVFLPPGWVHVTVES